MWPCEDTDSIPFEDRPLSKLKESDRCSASENLYLDALSLDDEPEGPSPLRDCLAEVSLGLSSEVPSSRREPSLDRASVWQSPLPACSPDNLCVGPSEFLPMVAVLFRGPDPAPAVVRLTLPSHSRVRNAGLGSLVTRELSRTSIVNGHYKYMFSNLEIIIQFSDSRKLTAEK